MHVVGQIQDKVQNILYPNSGFKGGKKKTEIEASNSRDAHKIYTTVRQVALLSEDILKIV